MYDTLFLNSCTQTRRHPVGAHLTSSSRMAVAALLFALSAVPAHAQVGQEDADGEEIEAGEVPVPQPPADAVLPEVEPVISNDEFNSSIPDLDATTDAELNQPLESIAEFERRLAAEEADADSAEGAAPPAGLPALADGDTVEEIGDAPINDAQLAAPLPPIEQFDVEPVEIAEDQTDQETVEIAYRVELNGLEAADEATEVDLAAMFDDLSALEDGDGQAENVAMLSARLTEDSELIQNILSSEGWFGSEVSTRIDLPQDPAAGDYVAILDVTPGQRYSFSEINIAASPTVPPTLIRDNLALEVGEPIVAERVQGAEAQVAVTLPQEGYPFATVGQRDILLDQYTGGGVYTLPVDVGPRGRFGGFETTGNLAFDADHVETLARFERGELYDSRDVDDLRKALVATGLFNTVSVEPKRTGQDAGDNTEYVTIAVDQDAGPPRTIAGSAGYGTGEGFRVEGSWTHRNLFPPEGALIASAVAGTLEQGAGVTFRRSNAGRRDRTFQLGLDARRSNYDAFEAFTGRLAARISYDSTPLWQKRFTYAYGVQLIGTSEDDYDFSAGERKRRTFYIGGLTGQVGFDTSDDLLNPTEGYRLTAFVEPEGSLQDGFTPYVRARVDGSAYYSVNDSLVLAGRVRVATIQGIDRFDLAPSRRYYAGGGGSVRGFGYQELGPKDPDDNPIGGRSLNEAAAELRYRFGNFGVVGFVDAGQVYTSSMPKFSDIRYGVGVGGRFYTNFGPLRADIAMPINRQPGESQFAVYVSIGQAF